MVSGPPPQIAVVFLAYLPYGEEPVQRFFKSYRDHPAGVDHRLIVALKGKGTRKPLIAAEQMRVPADCLDLGTYIWLARRIDAQRFCFFNTSSEILDDDWLAKLNGHLKDDVGIVGATGSYGKSGERRRSSNPHIRTNAFMLERDLMLSLDWQEPIETKEQAFAVEHGERSITVQIRERGLEALVVGRDGQAFAHGSWIESNTFWINGQENLLVADNATRKYTDARNGAYRRVLTRFAWL